MFHDGVFMADARNDNKLRLAAVLLQDGLQTGGIRQRDRLVLVAVVDADREAHADSAWVVLNGIPDRLKGVAVFLNMAGDRVFPSYTTSWGNCDIELH